MGETVLITGASGLLGRALAAEFSGRGFRVLAHYHRRRGPARAGVRWLAGDFSTGERCAAFLKAHARDLAACSHVIHNYGPIAEKDTKDVTAGDLLSAYRAQLQPALDITRFLLDRSPLRAALFIAFAQCGRVRAYRRILAYAMAKNALPLLSRSLAAAHPEVRFNVFSPPTLVGAAVAEPGAAAVPPAAVAARIFQIMRYRRSGRHYRFAAGDRG